MKKIFEGGSSVKKGEKLVGYDIEYIKKKAKSHKTPVLISNMDMVESIERDEWAGKTWGPFNACQA